MTWYVETSQTTLDKAAIYAHVTALKARGVTDSSINQRLAAIRKLANEAADNYLIDESTAQAISRVGNSSARGRNWAIG